MKKFLMLAAAAATFATMSSVGFSDPASAQVVVREGRHGGVAVRVGEGRRYHRGPVCRTVTERTRVGHRVIVKTRRVCR